MGTALLLALEAWAKRKGLARVRFHVFEFDAGIRTLDVDRVQRGGAFCPLFATVL